MSVLLERGQKVNRETEVWLCEVETDAENDINEALQDIPASAPMGSFALIITDKGLITYIKGKTGWKPTYKRK